MDPIASKADWIERCARHFQTVAGLGEPVSFHIAEACWLNALDNYGTCAAVLAVSPEEEADEEMQYWGGD